MANVFPVPTVLPGDGDPVAEFGEHGLGVSGKLTDTRMSALIYHQTGQIVLENDLENYRQYKVDNCPFRVDVVEFLAGYEYDDDEWKIKS